MFLSLYFKVECYIQIKNSVLLLSLISLIEQKMGQFKALATKNWILYKRNIIGSILELALPIIFVLFFILVRNLAKIQSYDEQQYLTNSNTTFQHYGDPLAARVTLGVTIPTVLKNCSNGQVVALVPTGDAMVTNMKAKFVALGYTVKQYGTDAEIDTIVRSETYGTQYPYFCFGISFENTGSQYKYNLRFNISNGQGSTEAPAPTLDLTTKRNLNILLYGSTLRSGLIGVTNMVNNAILETQVSTAHMLVNKQGPIYQEAYVNDPIYNYLANSAEFLVLLPLLILYLRQTSSMLQQKQKKIRQSMSITGMKLWVYYLTWFIRYFVVYLILHLICSAIISGIFPNVPFYIPFVIFILFDILLIIQSFFIQIFVTRAKIGIIFALLFFVLQYVINYIVANNPDPTVAIYRAISIVPHVAFILAFKQMLYAESLKISVNFTDVINNYTISTAIICIFFNIIFWGILTWYLDQVFPNEWGAKKHPCFCCVSNRPSIQQYQPLEKSALQTKVKPIQLNLQMTDKIKSVSDPEVQSVEGKYKEMQTNKKAIVIKNLNKVFNGDMHAVKDLSMSIYSDQIFVLLGHNGAGKTTTISMLTGMIQPSSGLIQVLGQTDLTQYRSKIGVCPQHDTLYEDLTVQEHIRLFATFRGLQGDQLEQEVEKLIKDVNLQEKKSQYSKNLSGGQKRRLSVAMAFSGGAKVIILDEPTSGMDTSARRYIWEMLKNYKNDRIILLTTHFMDEADYLGDRIAIMAGGKLVALGSNVYLKNKFGVGYNLTFVKSSIDVSSQNIIKCVSKFVNNATVLSNVSSEVVMQLPMDKINFFPQMFTQIDSKKKELGIETYGISITTLQEVFLKVGQADEQNHKQLPINSQIISPLKQIKGSQMQQIRLQRPSSKKTVHAQQSKEGLFEEESWVREDGCCQRFLSHTWATILKRLRVIRRDLKSFVFELVLPMLIILLALMLMRISFVKDFDSQQLSYRNYTKQGTPVYVPIGANSANSALLTSLQTKMSALRGDILNIDSQTAGTDIDFDKNILFPKKKQLTSLKGGIYFEPTAVQSGKTKVPFTSIINTRSPTSVVAVQVLAAETYINHLSSGAKKITVVSKPLPRTYQQLRINNAISGFFGAMIFSIALSFKFASIVSFIVKEREDRSKHQQIVSGLNIASYWVGNYIYDFILYIIVAAFSVIMCQVLKIQTLIDGEAFTGTCLLFFFYGLANIPLTYILGYLFKDYGNAQGAIYFFNFVSGGIITLIILVLRWIDSDSNKIGRGLAWPLRMIPSFAFGEGLVNMGSKNNEVLKAQVEVFQSIIDKIKLKKTKMQLQSSVHQSNQCQEDVRRSTYETEDKEYESNTFYQVFPQNSSNFVNQTFQVDQLQQNLNASKKIQLNFYRQSQQKGRGTNKNNQDFIKSNNFIRFGIGNQQRNEQQDENVPQRQKWKENDQMDLKPVLNFSNKRGSNCPSTNTYSTPRPSIVQNTKKVVTPNKSFLNRANSSSNIGLSKYKSVNIESLWSEISSNNSKVNKEKNSFKQNREINLRNI